MLENRDIRHHKQELTGIPENRGVCIAIVPLLIPEVLQCEGKLHVTDAELPTVRT